MYLWGCDCSYHYISYIFILNHDRLRRLCILHKYHVRCKLTIKTWILKTHKKSHLYLTREIKHEGSILHYTVLQLAAYKWLLQSKMSAGENTSHSISQCKRNLKRSVAICHGDGSPSAVQHKWPIGNFVTGLKFMSPDSWEVNALLDSPTPVGY